MWGRLPAGGQVDELPPGHDFDVLTLVLQVRGLSHFLEHTTPALDIQPPVRERSPGLFGSVGQRRPGNRDSPARIADSRGVTCAPQVRHRHAHGVRTVPGQGSTGSSPAARMAATATSAGVRLGAAARAAHRWQARAPRRMLSSRGAPSRPQVRHRPAHGARSGPRVGDQGFHPRGPQLGLGLLMGQERSNPALPAAPAATLPTPDTVQPRGDQRPAGQALARPRHIGPRIRHHRLHPGGAHVRDRDQWVDPPAHHTPCHPKGPQLGRARMVGPGTHPRHPHHAGSPGHRPRIRVRAGFRHRTRVCGPAAANWWCCASRSRWLGPDGLLGDGIAGLDPANTAAVAAAFDALVEGRYLTDE